MILTIYVLRNLTINVVSIGIDTIISNFIKRIKPRKCSVTHTKYCLK